MNKETSDASRPFEKWNWAGRVPSKACMEHEVLDWVRRTAHWWVFPHGWGTEPDGSHVIFDEYKRPICRKKATGQVEVVRSNVKIDCVSEHLLYGDEGPGGSFRATKNCLELVERLGIREEIEYRVAISDTRGLPGGTLP